MENYNTVKTLGFWLWLRWTLANQEQRAQMVISRRELTTNEFVTIKCKKCSRKICLQPTTVMLPPKCICGNEDSGDCRLWPKGQFGNFKLVQIYTLPFPRPILF